MAREVHFAGTVYEVQDTISDVSVSDSFVKWHKTGTGSGESRLYLGPQTGNAPVFFGDFPANCFFLSADLKSYLQTVRWEYETPRLVYAKRQPSSATWTDLVERVTAFPPLCPFSLEEALGEGDEHRYFVRSHDDIYTFFRECALPGITKLSIAKLVAGGRTLFYFRPTVDYSAYSPVASIHPAQLEELEREIRESDWEGETEREQVVLARCGQGRFRQDLLSRYPACLVTGVTDTRLLVASHVKPWRDCTNEERISIDNGLVLTPNLDRLFDRGLVSFDDDGAALLSPFLAPDILMHLGIEAAFRLSITPTGEQSEFLDFHRTQVFAHGMGA